MDLTELTARARDALNACARARASLDADARDAFLDDAARASRSVADAIRTGTITFDADNAERANADDALDNGQPESANLDEDVRAVSGKAPKEAAQVPSARTGQVGRRTEKGKAGGV